MQPQAALLAWYDRHRRRLPWRVEPGETPDPYRVWLSEIMLQQTTVTVVIPYFEKFLLRFPTVADLAAADADDVMRAWAGLGYYARARNLHAAAKAVTALGSFPASIDALRALPGIGLYTSAAIAAIAFNRPVIPVDGNVERVVARRFAIDTPLPAAKPAIAAAAQSLAGPRPADLAQALFDLGASVCTPTNPACAVCPWAADCIALHRGIVAELPRKIRKKPRPVRHGAHFHLTDHAGNLLLRRRPPRGLLGGMVELPGTAWRSEPWPVHEALAHAPMPAQWRRVGQVRHVFTHFELHLHVYAASVTAITAEGSIQPLAAAAGEALPSLMRKCLAILSSAQTAG